MDNFLRALLFSNRNMNYRIDFGEKIIESSDEFITKTLSIIPSTRNSSF